jgi:hypothetical protein
LAPPEFAFNPALIRFDVFFAVCAITPCRQGHSFCHLTQYRAFVQEAMLSFVFEIFVPNGDIARSKSDVMKTHQKEHSK